MKPGKIRTFAYIATLRDASQFDRKFIVLHVKPAISLDGSTGGGSCTGNGTGHDGSSGFLAVMDQHAADERVRLEVLQDALLQVWPLTQLAFMHCRDPLYTLSCAIRQTADQTLAHFWTNHVHSPMA